jgi:hypothetical protein
MVNFTVRNEILVCWGVRESRKLQEMKIPHPILFQLVFPEMSENNLIRSRKIRKRALGNGVAHWSAGDFERSVRST